MSAAPATFHRRAEEALADAALRAKVQRVTGRMVAVRHAGFAGFAEGEPLRDRARAIRAEVIAHLDRHLAAFAGNLEARGGHVHWAEHGEDVLRIVVEIARSRGVRTVVKSKSMVSEEVALNPALEAAGLTVVETDLGEYIAQLDRDHPSHIIMPILHKSREDVAAIFRREIHASDEDLADVPQMTRLARRTLRSAFLDADMGISGVNFGVAATGSICLVTNEGNGRLTTTVPRVHVALMGIERLVPTLDDLATMLQLLARSGTGQPLSVYTNLLTGPRRPGEADGPEELHVVLVDNGRTRLVGGELAEILYCIRCGACLNACPVYQSIGGHAYGSVYPGPVGSVLSPGLYGLGVFSELPHASSLCGACREVCPVRIDIPRMLLALRAEGARQGLGDRRIGAGLRMFAAAARRPRVFRALGALARRAARLAARDGWVRRLPGPFAGWTRFRDFPAPARKSFHQLWRERRR